MEPYFDETPSNIQVLSNEGKEPSINKQRDYEETCLSTQKRQHRRTAPTRVRVHFSDDESPCTLENEDSSDYLEDF